MHCYSLLMVVSHPLELLYFLCFNFRTFQGSSCNPSMQQSVTYMDLDYFARYSSSLTSYYCTSGSITSASMHPELQIVTYISALSPNCSSYANSSYASRMSCDFESRAPPSLDRFQDDLSKSVRPLPRSVRYAVVYLYEGLGCVDEPMAVTGRPLDVCVEGNLTSYDGTVL